MECLICKLIESDELELKASEVSIGPCHECGEPIIAINRHDSQAVATELDQMRAMKDRMYGRDSALVDTQCDYAEHDHRHIIR